MQWIIARPSGIGKLLQALGIPQRSLWLLLGLWIVFMIYRRVQSRIATEAMQSNAEAPVGRPLDQLRDIENRRSNEDE